MKKHILIFRLRPWELGHQIYIVNWYAGCLLAMGNRKGCINVTSHQLVFNLSATRAHVSSSWHTDKATAPPAPIRSLPLTTRQAPWVFTSSGLLCTIPGVLVCCSPPLGPPGPLLSAFINHELAQCQLKKQQPYRNYLIHSHKLCKVKSLLKPHFLSFLVILFQWSTKKWYKVYNWRWFQR